MKDRTSRFRRRGRFIAEMRYKVVPSFVDHRGQMIADLHSQLEEWFPHWKSGSGLITFLDRQENPLQEFTIGYRRSAVVLEDQGQVQHFIDRTTRYFQLVYDSIGDSIEAIDRFGVRIVEVLEPEDGISRDDAVEIVLENHHKIPEDLDLPFNDSLSKVVHEHGFYQIGPAFLGDAWLENSFSEPERDLPDVGIGLDVDSYQRDLIISSFTDIEEALLAVTRLTKTVEESVAASIGLSHE